MPAKGAERGHERMTTILDKKAGQGVGLGEAQGVQPTLLVEGQGPQKRASM